MGRQKTCPMKGQNKTPDKELTERDTCYLLAAEFKSRVIRMLTELRGRVVELNKNFNREIKTYK